MEIKDWIMIAIALGSILAAYFRNQNKTELVERDLQNHISNHNKLEQRVTDHESKIDDKLDALSDKVDGLTRLIIEKFK